MAFSKQRLLLFGGTVATAITLFAVFLIQVRSGPTPSLSHVAQITHTGFTKFAPVVSDGKQLFFSEQQNGRYWISTVPIGGGDTREFHTAIPNLWMANCQNSPESGDSRGLI
jgi:hypothetical protein